MIESLFSGDSDLGVFVKHSRDQIFRLVSYLVPVFVGIEHFSFFVLDQDLMNVGAWKGRPSREPTKVTQSNIVT